MYLRIPGNNEFTISKELKLRKKGIDYPYEEADIEIYLYGKQYTMSLSRVYLIAYYCLDMPNGYKDKINDIEFAEIELKSHKVTEPYIPILRNPIIVNEKYRMIASIPKYAIAEDGKVIDIESGRHIRPVLNKNGYYYVSFYSTRLKRSVGRSVHRLLAIAWMADNDFKAKPILNHIDGDKLNIALSNLEWTSFSENAKHAIANNLTPNHNQYKVWDMIEDKVSYYPSMTEMGRAIGHPRISYLSDKMILLGQYIVLNRYAIKLATDDTPFYTAAEYDSLSGVRTNLRIEIKNMSTGEVTPIFGNEESKKFLGVTYDYAKTLGLRKTQKLTNGYIVRGIGVLEWKDITIVEDVYASKPLIALKLSTNEETEFPSLRRASVALNIDKKTIGRRLDTGKEYMGYTFKTKTE